MTRWTRGSFFADLIAAAYLQGRVSTASKTLSPRRHAEAAVDLMDSPCVELGVQRGDFSVDFLSRLNRHATLRGVRLPRYFMVDVWRELPVSEYYYDGGNVANERHRDNLHTLINRTAPYWDSMTLLQLRSRDAARIFRDGELSFVYLDARHDYCAVYEDLQLYWPKLRPGGLIAGDDFFSAKEYSLHCENGTRHSGGVEGAVKDFVSSCGGRLRTIDGGWLVLERNPRPQWWIRKPFESTTDQPGRNL